MSLMMVTKPYLSLWKLSIQYSNPKAFINAFEAMEKGRPKGYSDRGRKRTVLFEGTTGNYVKIGRVVYINAWVHTVNINASGSVKFTGLPFTVSASSNRNGMTVSGYNHSNAGQSGALWMNMVSGTSEATFWYAGDTYGTPQNMAANYTIGSNAELYISGWYYTN